MAHALQANLASQVECTVWDQGVFRLSHTALEALIGALSRVDCATFVFSDDDTATIRGALKSTTRDNVIFEFGLAIGMLGRESTFMVVPQGNEQLHLPTDLLGLTAATYRTDRGDGNLQAALGPAATQIASSLAAL